MTATVSGLHEAAGSVTFTVEGSTETRVVDVAATTGTTYTAQFTVENVPAGTYKVRATFASPNYVTSQTERTFDKEKNIRTIDVDSSYRKTYGDADFKLSAQAVPATDHDMWTYEVVDDGKEAVVAVDDQGNVSIKHAGRALVKVTLTDGTGDLYEPVEAIVEIDVAKKEITVASQLMDEAGGAPQTSVVYGSIPTDPSRYVLSIGNATDAEAARIRDALAAQPLDAATPAGTAVIKIARRTAGAGGGGASTTGGLKASKRNGRNSLAFVLGIISVVFGVCGIITSFGSGEAGSIANAAVGTILPALYLYGVIETRKGIV